MKRTRGDVMSARFVIIAGILGALLVGCAENRSSFFIQQFQVVSEDCEATSDSTGASHTYGILDVGFKWEYSISPLLVNQMSPIANSENFLVETNSVQVEGANIRIWRGGRAQGNPFYEFYQPAVSFVPPSSTTVTSFVGMPRQAVSALLQYAIGIPPEELTFNDMLGYRDLITIGVTMLGTTTGGQEVETPEFYFPIHLCFGCRVICPAESRDEETSMYCEATDAPEEAGCSELLGQDYSIDCRWCATAFGPEEGPALCRQYFCGIGG
jgi:hypothetical protein